MPKTKNPNIAKRLSFDVMKKDIARVDAARGKVPFAIWFRDVLSEHLDRLDSQRMTGFDRGQEAEPKKNEPDDKLINLALALKEVMSK